MENVDSDQVIEEVLEGVKLGIGEGKCQLGMEQTHQEDNDAREKDGQVR